MKKRIWMSAFVMIVVVELCGAMEWKVKKEWKIEGKFSLPSTAILRYSGRTVNESLCRYLYVVDIGDAYEIGNKRYVRKNTILNMAYNEPRLSIVNPSEELYTDAFINNNKRLSTYKTSSGQVGSRVYYIDNQNCIPASYTVTSDTTIDIYSYINIMGSGSVDYVISTKKELLGSLTLLCDGDTPTMNPIDAQATDGSDYTGDSWTRDNVKYTFSGSDATSGLKGYQVSTDGEKSWTDVTGNVYVVSTEGIQSLSFRAVDNVGNTSAPQKRTVKIDKTAPHVSITGGYSGGTWSTENVTYSVGAADTIKAPLASDSVSGLANFGCNDSSVTKSFSGVNPYSYVVTNGKHSITFYAADNAGNSVSAGPYTVNVDTEIPVLSVAAEDSAGNVYTSGAWTNENVGFTLTGSDSVSGVRGYQYKLSENGSIDDCTGSTWTAGSTQNVWFRAVDNAGNTGSWTAYSVRIDKIAPSVALDTGTQSADRIYYLSAAALKKVTCVCTDSGGSSIRLRSCSVDGAQPVIYSTMDGADIQNCIYKAGTGKHTYTLTVADNAGNRCSTGVTVLYDDTEIRTDDIGLSLSDAHHAGNTILEDTKYTANITNAVPVVRVQTDGGAQGGTVSWTIGGRTFTGGVSGTSAADGKGGSWYAAVVRTASEAEYAAYVKNLSDGDYPVSVTVTDLCGNTSTKEFVLTKDTAAPKPLASWLKSVETDSAGNGSCKINLPEGTEKTSLYKFNNKNSMNTAAGNGFAGENPVFSNFGTTAADTPVSFTVQGQKAELYLAAVDGCGNYEESVLTIVEPDAPDTIGAEKNITADTEKGTASFYLSVTGLLCVPVRIQAADIDGDVYTVSYKTVYKCIGLKENKEMGESVAAADRNGAYCWSIDKLTTAGAWGTGSEHKMHIWAEYCDASAAAVDGNKNPADVVVVLNREGTKTAYTIPDSAPVFPAGEVNWPEYIGAVPAVGWVSAADPDGDAVWYRVRIVSGANKWYTGWTNSIENVFDMDKLYTLNEDGTTNGADAEDVKSSAVRSGLVFYFDAWADSNSETKPDQNVQTCVSTQHKAYDTSHCDFTAPVVTADDPLWNSGIWTNVQKFKCTAADDVSGVNDRLWKLEPVGKDNNPDSSGGRPSYSKETTGIVQTDGGTAFFVEPPALTGKYKLTLTVTDKAGNSGTLSVYGLFDTTAPEITAAAVKELADSGGWISAGLTASDGGSGVTAWTWRQGEGSWEEWKPWKNGECKVKPDWSAGSSASLSFKVKDEAGNESAAYQGGSAEYDSSVPGFSVVLTGGVSGSGSSGTYVTDTDALEASVQFPVAQDMGSGLTQVWGIVCCTGSEETDVCSGASDWKRAKKACIWNDGKTYRVKVILKNKNGVAETKRSGIFTVDTTPPESISVALVLPENRSACYRNERFDVKWSGGDDTDTGAQKTVELYQKTGTKETVLNRLPVGSGSARVRVGWGTGDIEWNKGNFFVRGRSVNGAGTETVSAGIAVSVSGKGMTVYMPDYIADDGTFGASWESSGAGTGTCRYSLYKEGAAVPVVTGTTADGSVVLDVSGRGLSEGDKVYLETESLDADGNAVEKGSSLSAVVDGSAPDVKWTSVPEAVSSAALRASFTAEDNISGIQKTEWCVQKKKGDGWETIAASDNGWNTFSGTQGTVAADLSSYAATGAYVRLVVQSENGAGKLTTVWTGAIAVDDSAPPAPRVIDQGSVVNYTKQSVTCNWRMSGKDQESGITAYYWGWYYAGETTNPQEWTVTGKSGSSPEQWTMAAVTDETASVDLSRSPGIDGKTVVFAVKSVNGAGLDTVGFSDGIILDSTAPYIHGIAVYGSNMKKKLGGYTAQSDIQGGSVYVQIENAADEESWVDGASVQAYELDSAGKRSAYGGALILTKDEKGTYGAAVKIGSSLEGTAWLFEARAVDAGGNISVAAESDGFIIEGSIPSVTGLKYTADTNRVSLDWVLAEGNGSRWVSGYTVQAVKADGTVLVTESVQSCSASFVWRNGNFNLKNGDSIVLSVNAYSYTGAASAAASVTLTIDLAPPEYDAEKSKIPSGDRVTYWYDGITGHVQYGSGKTGVGSIEWSAVLVPGEEELVAWQEAQSVNQLDISRELTSVRDGTLSWWQGKKVRIRVRAANGMGIWSSMTNIRAVEADTTEPEIQKAERDWAWTNESGSVKKWTLTAEDDQSGILAWRIVIVPSETDEASFDWKSVSAVAAEGGKGKPLKIEDAAGTLTSNNEGTYKPLLAVQNGSGHWSVCSGAVLTVDRTAPAFNTEKSEWNGCESQKLTIKDTPETVYVSNGPEQAYTMTAGEDVKWKISGEGLWFTEQTYPAPAEGESAESYKSTAAGSIPFGANPAGYVYTVEITMTDRAGNTGHATAYLRYNRAPQITVQTDNLTVWPGHTRTIDELITVNDDEGSREGDYPLTYRWDPANGKVVQAWTGGVSLQNIYGESQNHGTVFTQKTEKTQTSYYPGTLTVTDRYGKSASADLTVKVENTREGKLLVDEYWSGAYEITGEVAVPGGLTLTMDGSSIQAGGTWNDGEECYESGVTVEKGGTLKTVHTGETNSIESCEAGKVWQGVTVNGNAAIDGLLVRDAERGITLGIGGSVTMKNAEITSCITGIHLLGGTLSLTGSRITNNSEYGIKKEKNGSYRIRTTEIDGNEVNYYDNTKTVLTEQEIKALEEE
jgi:hypothetical protein